MFINSTAQHIDFKLLYEQQLSIVNEQQKLLELYKITIANHLTIEAKHQEANELQSQKINLLQLQIIELQKFILAVSKKSLSLILIGTNNKQPCLKMI